MAISTKDKCIITSTIEARCMLESTTKARCMSKITSEEKMCFTDSTTWQGEV